MYDYYFTFRSLTLAQQARHFLSTKGILSKVQRSPKSVSSEGCSYALKISQIHAAASASYLRTSGLLYTRVLSVNPNGTVKEVFL